VRVHRGRDRIHKHVEFIVIAEFKPETAIAALSYAAYFDPAYTRIVRRLLDTSDTYPNWQSVLNAVKN